MGKDASVAGEENTRAIKSDGPLAGVRILDLTSVLMGPYATQILGDLGADVIIVERPDGGGNRQMGASADAGPHPDLSGIALNLLRNKRSVALDMKQKKARDAVLRIASSCDVVITNLRPKPLMRLGLAYSDVKQVKADIIFCQAHGFRSDGPRADEPAYDDIIQSESGLADAARLSGRDPAIPPTILADKLCGLAISNAVLAALFYRSRTGQGQRIEVPMADVMRAFVLVEHGGNAIPVPPVGAAGYERVLSLERGPQPTRDGWINVMPYSTAAYEALFRTGGRDDLIGDERLKGRNMALHATFLYQQLRKILIHRTTDEWIDFCSMNDIPAGRVRTLEELVAELPVAEHSVAGIYRSIPCPIWFGETPAGLRTEAPLFAQQTAEVLSEAGLSESEIDELHQTGAAVSRDLIRK